MVLRKSHSTEWHSQGPTTALHGDAAPATLHAMALQQHFEELRQELGDFNAHFGEWVASRRQALTSDKEAYLRTLSEERDLVEGLQKQLTGLVSRRQAIVAELQQEQDEYDEAVNSNHELETQRKQLAKRLVELRESMGKIREELETQEKELEQRESHAQRLAFREELNVALCQEKLGLYVESLAEATTKFSFKYIDPADWERRFAVVIDVSTNRYRIHACDPMIPHLSVLVDQVNSDADFYAFLRRVRSAFVDLVASKK